MAPTATQIVAVRTAPSAAGGMHSHISAVKTADGRVLSRAVVIQRINAGWEQFCTIAGNREATVVVVRCPHCWTSDYIKTTADSTTADNLLRLPRF